MATEAPPAPTGEININQLVSRSGNRTPLPAETIAAINAAAQANGGDAAEPVAPSPEPIKAPDVAPAGTVKQPEPVKPVVTPPAPEPKPKKEGIESVREALERQTNKTRELETSLTATAKEKADAFTKLAELEAKAAKYEKDIDENYKPRVARLEQAEKEIQRTQEILKIKAYQETDEFHSQFVKPLADANAEVSEILADLVVPDGEGNYRAATQADFDAVLAAPNANMAQEVAEAKFGKMAISVMMQRQKIKSLKRSRDEHLKNAQLRAEEYEKHTHAQAAQQRQFFHEKLMQATQAAIAADTDTFTLPEGDAELLAAKTEGEQLADRLLNGDPSLTPDQFVGEIAKGRKNIIAAPVLSKKLAAAKAKIASLEEQLKAYQKSEPDVRTRNGGPAAPSGDSPRDKLLAAAQALATKV